jgi:hypothetical protein
MKPQDLDFDTWDELYLYILKSKINGQHKQSKSIYKSLEIVRQEQFEEWLKDLFFMDATNKKEQEEFNKLIDYYKLN